MRRWVSSANLGSATATIIHVNGSVGAITSGDGEVDATAVGSAGGNPSETV